MPQVESTISEGCCLSAGQESPDVVGSSGDGQSIGPALAHDLSNTLAAGIAAARLIHSKSEDEGIRELADIVLRQLDKAAGAIHQARR
jgi:hypothetical protein